MANDIDHHSAADPALGYLYQCRNALLAAVRESKLRPGLQISVERFDDIAFDENDEPKALIQTKQQVLKTGDLGDLSADLWKTLYIWAKKTRDDPLFPFQVRLFLLTTATAAPGTAASFLRTTERDEAEADRRLLEAVLRSRAKMDKALARFVEYRNLVPEQRTALLKAITILDGSPNIVEVETALCTELIHAVKRERVPLLVERLEGWWFGQVVRALVDGQASIPVNALDAKIGEIRDGLVDTSLPVDFLTQVPPTEIVDACDQRG
jgi:hypothetical protein